VKPANVTLKAAVIIPTITRVSPRIRIPRWEVRILSGTPLHALDRSTTQDGRTPVMQRLAVDRVGEILDPSRQKSANAFEVVVSHPRVRDCKTYL
jgi:hypothetical protein